MEVAFFVSLGFNALVAIGMLLMICSLSQNTHENGELMKELTEKTEQCSKYRMMWHDAQTELNEKGNKICDALGRYRGHDDLVTAVRQLRERCEQLETEQSEKPPIWEHPHD